MATNTPTRPPAGESSGGTPAAPGTPQTAKKTVRFSMDMLSNIQTTQANTDLAALRLAAESGTLKTPDVATTATLDDEEEAEEEVEYDVVALYRDAVNDALRYRLSTDAIDKHAESEMERMTGETKNDEFTFYSMTDDPAMSKINGLFTYDMFKKYYGINAKALFQEFRAATLLVSALRETNVELHTIAKRLNYDLISLKEWGEALCKIIEDTQTSHSATAEQLGLHAQQEIVDLREQVADFSEQIRRLKGKEIQTQEAESSQFTEDQLEQLREQVAKTQEARKQNADLSIENGELREENVRLRDVVGDLMLARQQDRLNKRSSGQSGQQQSSGQPSQQQPSQQPTQQPSTQQQPSQGAKTSAAAPGDPNDSSDSDSSDDEGDSSPSRNPGRDPRRNPGNGDNGGGDQSRRSATPGTVVTEISAGGTKRHVKRSPKFPDPPIWHDDTTSDKGLTFKVWMRKLKNKLDSNYDHYPEDRDRMGAIENFLGGQAAEDVMPYLEEGHPNQIKTSDELLEWLEAEYDDPNLKVEAKADYANLMMSNTQNFAAFKNRFVSLAGRLQKKQTIWKEEMHDKLANVPRLRNQLAKEYLNDKVSFREYCTLAQQLDLDFHRTEQLRTNKSEKKKNSETSTNGNKTSNRNSGSNNQSRQGTSTQGSSQGSAQGKTAIEIAQQRGVSREQLKRSYEAGECYYCHKPGHISKNCPDKPPPTGTYVPRDERRKNGLAAIDAIYDKEGAQGAINAVSNGDQMSKAMNQGNA